MSKPFQHVAVFLACSTSLSMAQTAPRYEIVRLGLFGPEYIGGDGYQYSAQLVSQATPGIVTGYAQRRVGTTDISNRHAWAYTAALNACFPIGLDGPEFTGTSGFQNIEIKLRSGSGLFTGESQMIAGQQSVIGKASWFYDPNTHTTFRLGLSGPEYVGVDGRLDTEAAFLNRHGQVCGTTLRSPGAASSLGYDSWVLRAGQQQCEQIGLEGGEYTSDTGARVSAIVHQNTEGHIVGYGWSYVFNPSRHAWLYSPSTQTTSRIGLLDPLHSSILSGHYSIPEFLNNSGAAAGYSRRYVNHFYVGQNSWYCNPLTQTCSEVGLAGPEHTRPNGYQMVSNEFLCDSGPLAGITLRVSGTEDQRGYNTWMYHPDTDTTVKTGLTGERWTSSLGHQNSYHTFNFQSGQYRPLITQSGHAAGTSQRYATNETNFRGENTWAYNPVTRTTNLTGLTGTEFTGTQGHQSSENLLQSADGIVFGRSQIFAGVQDWNGWATWIYNPIDGQTVRVGEFGPGYVGSAGFAESRAFLINDGGWAVGESRQIAGVKTIIGTALWLYNPISRTVIRLGLFDAAHTTADGRSSSFSPLLTQSGRVAAYTARRDVNGAAIGYTSWLYDPMTGITAQTGLTGAEFTGSAGFRKSTTVAVNGQGVAVGTSRRIAGVSTETGNDAWYFDPSTGQTTQMTLGVPDIVQLADGFSESTPVVLTEDGYAFGGYSTFASGVGPRVRRQFIYRPDIGFHDLGSLVEGGLDSQGWATLTKVEFVHGADWVVGTGLVQGQSATNGSQSVYLLRRLPDIQVCAADLDNGSGDGVPDGGVNIDDLLFFLVAFEEGNEAVDLDNDGDPVSGDPDGAVDVNDLIFFLIRFEQGC